MNTIEVKCESDTHYVCVKLLFRHNRDKDRLIFNIQRDGTEMTIDESHAPNKNDTPKKHANPTTNVSPFHINQTKNSEASETKLLLQHHQFILFG